MKLNNIFFLFITLCLCCGLWSCESKLNPETVKEQLLDYGSKNSENLIKIKTKYGTIQCSLYAETPLHRANFIRLIKNGYYDDKAEFYRIVHRFMIQGGDLGKLAGKKETTMIPAEFNNKFFHKRGALAMARPEENNPEKKSSPTEFYIIQGARYDSAEVIQTAKQYNTLVSPEKMQTYTTLGGDMSLDMRYTVFGEVIAGFEVIDKIAVLQTYNGDKPVQKIPLSIEILHKK
jgi:cyclophilin family peptidyl-prolyl cis-trans isomerase